MKRTFEELSDDEWEQNTFKPSRILNATNPPPPPIESFAYDPSKSAPNGVVDLTADDTEDEYAGVASGPARRRKFVIDDEEEEVDWRRGRGRRKSPVKRAELASEEKWEDITRTKELQERYVGACSGRSIPFRGRKFVIDDDDDEDTGLVRGRTGGQGLAEVVAVTSEEEWEDEVMGATSMDEEEVEEEDLVGRALQRCGRISEELRRELYGSSVPATASGGGYSEVDAPSARIVTQDEVSAACCGDDSDFEPLLKPYQLVGVNFLLLLRRKKIGGAILADEMGLGKTVQAITYLSLLNYLENDRGPHLVVCPASVLENWERELTRWCPSYSVLQYHGAARVAYSKELSSLAKSGKPPPFDVMLVCYSLFERRSAQQKDDRKILKRWPWSCVLMDEAHALKDKSSYRWKNLMSVARNAKQRLMLTGTPLQNDLHELWSMLEFLMPDLFATEDVDLKKLLNAEDRDLVTRMKSILGPFILRRQKSDVMQQLVPKVQKVEFVQMVNGQKDAYQEATEEYRSGPCFSKTSDADSKPISKLLSRRQISSYFTQLRKIANHPLLVRRINSDEDVVRFAQKLYAKGVFGFECTVDRVIEELKGYSDFSILQLLFNHGIEHADGSLLYSQVTESAKCQALATLLPSLKQDGHRVLIFSQWTSMLDILEWTLDVLGITYRRLDGSTPVSERQTIVDTFNNDISIDACLLSTRAGGQGLNLTGADTVIIHDMDFNPQIDRQAEDRCHRIGQTRPVTIYRLVTKSTVDEKIYEIAKRKLNLDAAVLEGGAEMDDEGEVTEKTMGEILSSILLV